MDSYDSPMSRAKRRTRGANPLRPAPRRLSWETGKTGLPQEKKEGAGAPSFRRSHCPADYCRGESETVACAEVLNRITPEWSVKK